MVLNDVPPELDRTRSSAGPAPVVSAAPATVGERLGDYVLEHRIGAGGMGEVFAARHVQTNQRVALKTLSTTVARRLYRFKREYRALADVTHSNLVAMHELVIPENGAAFYTMELIDGGVPIVDWIRDGATPGSMPDLDRLREALRQLLAGVEHIHAHDCIHRDLKPANVLVTAAGRVVVLDLGLVFEQAEPIKGVTSEGQVLGTPSHMAPEQALCLPLGPGTDLYAVGVMLFESLTGRLPPTAMERLLDESSETSPDPKAHTEGIPEPLHRLCRQLLALKLDERPSAAQVLEQLAGGSSRPSVSERIFVGREPELAALHEAFTKLETEPGLVVVHLQGPSGHGKSRLCQQFRRQVQARGAIVLHSRCRQQETVPYKGMDGVVDALSGHLRCLPLAERRALQPPHHDVLVRLFPVLDDLWPASSSRRTIEPPMLRRLGNFMLVDLFRRVGQTGPLVVHIDDVQWADRDAVDLLGQFASNDESDHRPAMILLLSYRSGTEQVERSAALRALLASERLAGRSATILELGALSFEDAQSMARALLPSGSTQVPPADEAQIEAIAMRAKGSPLFIKQLVRGGDLSASDSDSDLDRIVAQSLRGLGDEARRLLETVAVFGRPLSVEVAAAVSECVRPEATTADLDRRGLLVRANIEGHAHIEAAHDRVREVLLASLSAHERAERHWALGQALRQRGEGEGEGQAPRLFAIADQLGAGLDARRAGLPSDERLELAALQHRAGQQCLDAAAWEAARRYLRCAHDLLQPWMPQARAGKGPVELCSTVMFARAKAEHALDVDRGLALGESMMEWELAPLEYGRVVEWVVFRLITVGEVERGVEAALRGARRLGLRVPPRISWTRAGWSFLLGWRAMKRSGLLTGKMLVSTTEPRARARAIVIGVATLTGVFHVSDFKRGLWLLGQYGQLVRSHGAHDIHRCLHLWILVAMIRGRVGQARAMLRVMQQILEDPNAPFRAAGDVKYLLTVLLGMFHPMKEVYPRIREYHEQLRRIAPESTVEAIASSFCGNSFGYMTPKELKHVLRSERARPGRMPTTVSRFKDEVYVEISRLLTEGGPVAFDPRQYSGWGEVLRVRATMLYTVVAVMLGDFDTASALGTHVPQRYERFFVASAVCPLYAMASVIAQLEPRSSGRARRSGGSIRRHKAVARKYAAMCPENFGPMRLLIKAEEAAARGRDQDAIHHYEHARLQAADYGWHSVAGIAAHRLARVALRRGSSLVARAAFEAAQAAYTAWEAPAVVRVIEAERAIAGLDSALPGA